MGNIDLVSLECLPRFHLLVSKHLVAKHPPVLCQHGHLDSTDKLVMDKTGKSKRNPVVVADFLAGDSFLWS